MLRGVQACCEGCARVARGAGMLRAVRARRVRCGRGVACGAGMLRMVHKNVADDADMLRMAPGTSCATRMRYAWRKRVM